MNVEYISVLKKLKMLRQQCIVSVFYREINLTY